MSKSKSTDTKLQERGDKIEVLGTKTQEMTTAAGEFNEAARKLNQTLVIEKDIAPLVVEFINHPFGTFSEKEIETFCNKVVKKLREEGVLESDLDNYQMNSLKNNIKASLEGAGSVDLTKGEKVWYAVSRVFAWIGEQMKDLSFGLGGPRPETSVWTKWADDCMQHIEQTKRDELYTRGTKVVEAIKSSVIGVDEKGMEHANKILQERYKPTNNEQDFPPR